MTRSDIKIIPLLGSYFVSLSHAHSTNRLPPSPSVCVVTYEIVVEWCWLVHVPAPCAHCCCQGNRAHVTSCRVRSPVLLLLLLRLPCLLPPSSHHSAAASPLSPCGRHGNRAVTQRSQLKHDNGYVDKSNDGHKRRRRRPASIFVAWRKER